MNWVSLFETIKRGYFTVLLMEATNILAVAVYIRKKTENGIYLCLLSLASLIQTLSIQYGELVSSNSIVTNKLTNISIYVYTICEISFCVAFIQAYIRNKFFKKGILLSYALFVIAALYCFISIPASRKTLSGLEIIEGFIIIAACLYFFYELFGRFSEKSTLDNQEFWAISGMLLLFGLITPFFLALDYLKQNYWLLEKKLYIINNVAYSIMFTMFSIGILRDKKEPSIIT